MSKKLLEEQAVRKFMKIAGLQPLTNSFLKENEEADLEEAKKRKKHFEPSDDPTYAREVERAIRKDLDAQDRRHALDSMKKQTLKGRIEESETDLEEEVQDLEEARSGFVSERDDDDRASERVVGEAKELSAKNPKKMKGDSHKMKPLKEEEEMGDEAPEMDAAPEGEAATGGLDVEGLVKELIRVITEKVPGAADVVSVEEEGGETEVEMGGDEGGEGEMEGGEEELDEAALESVVAETVKRVKARLMESQKPKTLTKEALAKKVAAKVAERLKKT